MTTLLVHHATCIATLASTELADASLFVRDGVVEWIGPSATLPPALQQADEVIDARGHLVVPGLVNTHHHMYQSLTRAIPQVQDAELFSWLRGLSPIWAGLTPEMVQVSTQVAMAELLLSGCTTSSDHLYIYPNGVRLDDSIEAAQQIGMRFVATRGSMSVGQSQGGLYGGQRKSGGARRATGHGRAGAAAGTAQPTRHHPGPNRTLSQPTHGRAPQKPVRPGCRRPCHWPR